MTNTALYQCWLSAGISLSVNKRMKGGEEGQTKKRTKVTMKEKKKIANQR